MLLICALLCSALLCSPSTKDGVYVLTRSLSSERRCNNGHNIKGEERRGRTPLGPNDVVHSLAYSSSSSSRVAVADWTRLEKCNYKKLDDDTEYFIGIFRAR